MTSPDSFHTRHARAFFEAARRSPHEGADALAQQVEELAAYSDVQSGVTRYLLLSVAVNNVSKEKKAPFTTAEKTAIGEAFARASVVCPPARPPQSRWRRALNSLFGIS